MRIGADENGVIAGFGKLEPDRHQQFRLHAVASPKPSQLKLGATKALICLITNS
ncbi:hypothetical protein [Leptolyngbya sp. FACHB-711]|uniref:hypothetical protein n=1 Tax=unclassified Leptolyngbya TaxID=2650499 RepID=UPI001689E5C2|nr:hypothetical protein [Leptolyngbya sp. FACHB-711]MBD1851911.1 hypothetical protein [Cyanobacteria bacterium FACHB-502]MBD2023581.1 hypothetical protein [Leptolyngbya sp. FACHB-711]